MARRGARGIIFGILLLTCGCSAPQSIMRHVPVVGGGKYLPQNGAVPGLVRTRGPIIYREGRMDDYLGVSAGTYVNYGATKLAMADYSLGAGDRQVTVEIYHMEDPVAASGLYHMFRGRTLRGKGTPVDVGVEGVIDSERDRRNLYFYKGPVFVKVIYSGAEPVPDLLPLGQHISARLPGRAEKPRGYAYLEVPGVDLSTARVTPGYTFNYDFLPPAILAQAPAAGPIAEVFLIEHVDTRAAERTGQQYRVFLELNGMDYTTKYTDRRRLLWWGRDPQQGRVIATVQGRFLVGVLRPKTYPQGEALLERIATGLPTR